MNKTVTIKETNNGWIVSIDEQDIWIYHTWEEVQQFLDEQFGEPLGYGDSEPTKQTASVKPTDPFYPWGRGF